jgi:hypothetical protein
MGQADRLSGMTLWCIKQCRVFLERAVAGPHARARAPDSVWGGTPSPGAASTSSVSSCRARARGGLSCKSKDLNGSFMRVLDFPNLDRSEERMASPAGPLVAAFDVVRRTSTAHASAVDALERAFAAQMARTGVVGEGLKTPRSRRRRRRGRCSKRVTPRLCSRRTATRSRTTARP